jgi:hypothetical protein
MIRTACFSCIKGCVLINGVWMALRGWQTEILILHLSDPINEYWAASFGHSTATPELLMIDAEAASLNWRPDSFFLVC